MEFDKLILLGRGSTLYSGKASQAMLYFSSIGCSPLVAMNPAEFLIDVANGNFNDKSLPFDLEGKFMDPHDHNLQPNYDRDVHEFLVESYAASREGAWENHLDHADQPLHLLESAVSTQRRLDSSYKKVGAATWCEQFCILFTRGLKERRHDYFSPVRVTKVIYTAFIMGLLWWHSDASSPKGLEDQMGLLFFTSVFWGFLPLFTAVFTFPQERVMLAKERSVGMYRLSAYFVARNTCDLPLDLFLPLIFLLIVYLMVDLKPSFEAFSLTLLTVFLSIVAAQGLGLTIGAAFMDVKKATTVASITLMGFMLSGGFFIQKVPGFMLWIRYISFNYHTYRLLLRIQYGSSPGHGIKLGWVGAEVGAMLAMVIGYIGCLLICS